jgi:hypothetical protein
MLTASESYQWGLLIDHPLKFETGPLIGEELQASNQPLPFQSQTRQSLLIGRNKAEES